SSDLENDVIFVVAGTNKPISEKKEMKLGSPGDSINAIVVNSVGFDDKPTAYSRTGPVLSFFTKPDVSYYGGDEKNNMKVCMPAGEAFVQGTSYAAPWIARKMSYLIDVLGLSREVAKALLIHSATGWEKQSLDPFVSGHGIVPVKIEDIVNTPDDEMQFVLSGASEKYDTYNYDIPVPFTNDKHPFVAKATLCYFPSCFRNQGVDYTNTELDIQFGRVSEEGIKPIDNNFQSAQSDHYTLEEDARRFFRKWDNVKHIREISKAGNRAKKCYGKRTWGVSLKTKERLEGKYGVGLKFGIVITLKEINGVNRIDEFVKHCSLRGWLVNRIDIKQRVNVYNIAEQEIEFTE
ncbi:MAG TPA: serine protease, partial [Saprospirales bacterium]|nr:serine protease [Saprospirales bacterium]